MPPPNTCETCASYQSFSGHGNGKVYKVCKKLPVMVFRWGHDSEEGWVTPPKDYSCPLWSSAANPQVRPSLEYYLGLQYEVEIRESSEGGYVASVPDLPGCITQGESLPEVNAALVDAINLWIRAAYERGLAIPAPKERENDG